MDACTWGKLPSSGHPWAAWDQWRGLNGPPGALGSTLGSVPAGQSLQLPVPQFAHLWNGVSSDYSPPATFSDLCLKGCAFWHKVTCPWPNWADSVGTAVIRACKMPPACFPISFPSAWPLCGTWIPQLGGEQRAGGGHSSDLGSPRLETQSPVQEHGAARAPEAPAGSGGLLPGARGQCRRCSLAELSWHRKSALP